MSEKDIKIGDIFYLEKYKKYFKVKSINVSIFLLTCDKNGKIIRDSLGNTFGSIFNLISEFLKENPKKIRVKAKK